MFRFQLTGPLKLSLLLACAATLLLARAAPPARAAAATPFALDTDSPTRRLFELLGADEPLLEADVQELLRQLRCAATQAPPP